MSSTLLETLIGDKRVERIPGSMELCVQNYIVKSFIESEGYTELSIVGELTELEVFNLLTKMMGQFVPANIEHLSSGDEQEKTTHVTIIGDHTVISFG